MHTAESQSVIVAVGLLAFIAVIIIAAIIRYKTADEALKIVATLSGVMGIVSGAFVSYFFTREPLQAAQRDAATYRVQLAAAQNQVASLQAQYSEKAKDFAGLKDATSMFAYSLGGSGKPSKSNYHELKSQYDEAATKLKYTYGISGIPTWHCEAGKGCDTEVPFGMWEYPGDTPETGKKDKQ